MIVRTVLALAVVAVATVTASADFLVTGNPANDNFPLKGQALGVGNYVRSGSSGVFSYNFFAHEFQLSQTNPLTTMTNPWTPGDRIIMTGGVITPGTTAASLGWATGISNTAVAPGNQRINAKFGVGQSGPSPNNNFTASTLAPPGGNGNGSFGGGFGGFGSVQVSIGAGNMNIANAGLLLTPSNLTGSNVAQFFGITSGPGFGAQGLNLINNALNAFDVARYQFTVDGGGNLLSWEVFVNATMVQNYVSPFGPSAFPVVPTGGSNWIQTVQNGGGAFSDSLVRTDVYSTPAPATFALMGLGGFGLAVIRRVRR